MCLTTSRKEESVKLLLVTDILPEPPQSRVRQQEIVEQTVPALEVLHEHSFLVLNRNSSYFDELRTAAGRRKTIQIRSYGAHSDSDFQLLGMEDGPEGQRIRARIGSRVLEYHQPTSCSLRPVDGVGIVGVAALLDEAWERVLPSLFLGAEQTPRSTEPRQIGYLINNPKRLERRKGETFARIMTMSEALEPADVELLAYCPADIDLTSRTVVGYVLKERELVRVKRRVPSVNGNFLLKLRPFDRGIGYRNYRIWCREQRIEVCLPCELSELATDKYLSYTLIEKFDPELQPYTEMLDGSKGQLADFLARYQSVFIKPCHGGLGNGSAVLRKLPTAVTATYYQDRKSESAQLSDVDHALEWVKPRTHGRKYIIQAGIQGKRYQGTAIDFRVEALHDGEDWEVELQGRVGAKDSDLSNTHQGGYDCDLHWLLDQVYRPDEAAALAHQVTEIAKRLASYLETHCLGKLMELGVDFVLDEQNRPFISEINSNPGLIWVRDYGDLFTLSAEEQCDFDRDVRPRGEVMARFLLSRLRQSRLSKPIWFEHVSTALSLTPRQREAVMRYISALINGHSSTVELPTMVAKDRQPRIVFLSISNGPEACDVALGDGEGLKAAIIKATRRLSSIRTVSRYVPSHIKLDIVRDVQTYRSVDLSRPLAFDTSFRGLAFARPTEIAFIPELSRAQ